MCKHVSQRQLQNYKKKVLLTWLDELLAGNKVVLALLINWTSLAIQRRSSSTCIDVGYGRGGHSVQNLAL